MSFDDKEKKMDDWDDSILMITCEKIKLIDVHTRKELQFSVDPGTIEEATPGMEDFGKVGRIRISSGKWVYEFSKVRQECLPKS